jgi:hypothetical protein
MNPDFRDLLAAFNARGVDFLIVGAHALAAHGFVRATSPPSMASSSRTHGANVLLLALPIRMPRCCHGSTS